MVFRELVAVTFCREAGSGARDRGDTCLIVVRADIIKAHEKAMLRLKLMARNAL